MYGNDLQSRVRLKCTEYTLNVLVFIYFCVCNYSFPDPKMPIGMVNP